MIEDDLKTLIDAQWSGSLNGITKTCYVKVNNDPEITEEPAPGTNAVIIVILPSGGVPSRRGYGSDLFTWDGRYLIYSVTVANMKTAVSNLKTIAEGNTDGDLLLNDPSVTGDPREGHYFSLTDFTWKKIVARS